MHFTSRFSYRSVRSLLNFLLVFAAVAFIPGTQPARAQDASDPQTSRTVFPEPPLPVLPAAGGTFKDPTFGTEIMRVTDERDGGMNGTFYPHWPTLNSDSTRLLVRRRDAGDALYTFNPDTFTLGDSYVIPRLPDNGTTITEGAIWSTTDPDTLYVLGWAGPKLWSLNARTRQYTLVHDFTRDSTFKPGDFLWQMSMSADNDVFAFSHKGNEGLIGYTVYKRSTDKVLLDVRSTSEDEVRIDKTGRYLSLFLSIVTTEGFECIILDLATGTRVGLVPGAPDYAPGHGDVGMGTFIGWDNDENRFLKRSLSDPHQVQSVLNMGSDWMNQHLSMLARDESWGLATFYSYRGAGGTGPGLFHDEIVLMSTDGSGRFRRLVQHRSKANDYWEIPRSNISYDGRFAAFSSNWGGSARVDLFIAKINSTPAPPPTPTPIPTPTPTPTPSATPTPAPTPTPAATPTPTPALKAQNSLSKARQDAQSLSNELATTVNAASSGGTAAASLSPADRIAAVVADIQQTYIDFSNERTHYAAASRVETALSSALAYAATASNYAGQGQMVEAKTSLQKAIDNMELADVLMTYGDVQNPVDYAQYFVRQHYVDFLGREPDEAGRSFWTNQINSCGADAHCIEVKRVNVSAAYFLSIEFQQTGFLVHRLYRASYGRTALLRDFLGDVQEVGKGLVVGEPGWQDRLAANKSVFLNAWVQRADFRGRYDSMTNAQFVDSLYASMGVVPQAAERDGLVTSLQTGASTRADVLAKAVDNADFSRLERNRAFVLMQYFGYLRRDPDQAGFDFWLSKLEEFGGDFQRAEMVRAFLSSDEYRNRFRQQ